jgi:lipopolysaccharide/colanic/teichoic acid biosynthesis glycosyltransferase
MTGSIKQDIAWEWLPNLLGRAIALLICVFAFPLHLLICAAIRLLDHGPALHRCFRIGISGSFFELRKYRSMQVNVHHELSSGLKMIVRRNDPRLTWLGPWLRCGIDELPQLWNIFKGEMAWIGPRPDPDWMLPHYGVTCRERIAALPGITGLAQILNSRSLSTSEGFALDLWYLSHRTLWLDLWILLATPLYIAGWHSLGNTRLQHLRTIPEFVQLCRKCDEELADSKEILLSCGVSALLLPANTVIC